MLGGLGICGRPFCCSSFLGEFQPVSIKMAKEQGLSLNPTKISGTCGRLMCCLKYEQEAYEDLLRTTPKVGTPVQTPDGKGTVTEVSLLTGMLKVHLDKDPDGSVEVYNKEDCRSLRENRPKEQRPGKKQETSPSKQQRKEKSLKSIGKPRQAKSRSPILLKKDKTPLRKKGTKLNKKIVAFSGQCGTM